MTEKHSTSATQNPLISADDLKDVLLKKFAIFTGGHDKEFRSLIIFQDLGLDNLCDDSYDLLMQYFSSLSSMLTCVQEFTVIIDRRTGNWTVVKSVITKLNEKFPGNLHQIFVIKPQGFMQNLFLEKTICSIRNSCKIPILFVDRTDELLPFIDQQHLTTDLGGELCFDIEDWLTNRIRIEEYFEDVENLCTELKNILNQYYDKDCQQEESHQRQLQQQHDYSYDSSSDVSSLLKTCEMNNFYSYEKMLEFRKQRHHWLHRVSDCETRGLKIRECLLLRQSNNGNDNNNNTQEENDTEDGTVTCNTSSAWANTSDAYDLPVDYVFHMISFDRIFIRLTEARAELRRYWSEYIKRVRITSFVSDIEKQYYEFSALSNAWNNLIESLVDYLPVKVSNSSSLSPLHHSSQSSSDSNSSNKVTTNTLGYSPSHCIIHSALKDDCDEANSSLSKTMLEDLESLSCRILEAETTGGRLLPRLEELAKITNTLESFIVCKQEISDSNDLKHNHEASFLCDVSGLLSADLIPNNTCSEMPTTLTINASHQYTDINHNSSLSLCSREEEMSEPASSNADALHDTDYTLNTNLDECMKQRFPPVRFPSTIKDWSILFKSMIELASTDLPKAADQINRLLQLYTEIDNAASWIKEGRNLLETVTPPEKLTSMDLAECRTHMDELVAFTTSRQTRLELLGNPKLFHTRLAGLLDADLKTQLSKLLKQVEDLAQNCNLAIASVRQHISRTSFPRNHPNSQSFASSNNSTITSPERNSPVQEGVESGRLSSSSEGLNNNKVNNSVSLCQLPRLGSSNSLSTPAKRYQLAWKELVDTEKSYVNFLQHVYDVVWLNSVDNDVNCESGYRSYPQPTFMRDNQNRLLCNWPEILRFHRDSLLPHLEACDGNAEKIKAWVFLMVPRLVDLYTVYCSLHECAVQLSVVLEKDRVYSPWITACNEEIYRREMLTGKMNNQDAIQSSNELTRPLLLFSSRLVTPVQRFQRYHLLLDRLVKHETNECDRADLQIAHKTASELCETINVAMQLRGLSVRPSELGQFLLEGDFTVSRDDVRFMSSKQRHVFLFTNAILLTKYRTSASSPIPILTYSNSTSAHLSKDYSLDSYEKSTVNAYNTQNQSNNSTMGGTASNLLAFTKSFTSNSGNNSNNSSSISNNLVSNSTAIYTSGPFYEIKQELELSKIGLTPHFHGDRRRFAVWTAKRAVTFIFQSSDPSTRDTWVKVINELLMMQLLRDRYKVLNNSSNNNNSNNQVIQSTKLQSVEQTHFNSNASDRSKSLPVGGKSLSQENRSKKGSVVSLPSAVVDRNSDNSHLNR
uniref:DH domain-containing protein n=1 Tax=Trichobilharzia regenti TaxID=157069 RepID=A0AA85JVE0_TRIRE|nr:unnamed protein product [Trichobilharzia regenti]